MSNSFLCVLMSAHKSPKGMQIMRIVIKLQEHCSHVNQWPTRVLHVLDSTS